MMVRLEEELVAAVKEKALASEDEPLSVYSEKSKKSNL